MVLISALNTWKEEILVKMLNNYVNQLLESLYAFIIYLQIANTKLMDVITNRIKLRDDMKKDI